MEDDFLNGDIRVVLENTTRMLVLENTTWILVLENTTQMLKKVFKSPKLVVWRLHIPLFVVVSSSIS